MMASADDQQTHMRQRGAAEVGNQGVVLAQDTGTVGSCSYRVMALRAASLDFHAGCGCCAVRVLGVVVA